jgi:hypothetical protein
MNPERSWRATAAVAVVLVMLLALASSVSAGGFTLAQGPSTARPGQMVAFKADGMLPLKQVGVTIQLSRCVGSNGCAVGARGHWKSDEQGQIRVKFRFPPRYFNGCFAGGCEEHPLFLRGEYAQVQLCVTEPLHVDEEGQGHACAVKTVRIVAPGRPR